MDTEDTTVKGMTICVTVIGKRRAERLAEELRGKTIGDKYAAQVGTVEFVETVDNTWSDGDGDEYQTHDDIWAVIVALDFPLEMHVTAATPPESYTPDLAYDALHDFLTEWDK